LRISFRDPADNETSLLANLINVLNLFETNLKYKVEIPEDCRTRNIEKYVVNNLYNHPWSSSIMFTKESGIDPEACSPTSREFPYFKLKSTK
jgi:hypothetical protein